MKYIFFVVTNGKQFIVRSDTDLGWDTTSTFSGECLMDNYEAPHALAYAMRNGAQGWSIVSATVEFGEPRS